MQYFRHLSLRSLLCLILSGHFIQVLLYHKIRTSPFLLLKNCVKDSDRMTISLNPDQIAPGRVI